ncbi:hypothetical protein [Enterococcus xiangfangensis]|uniref:Uncharacterized protein n=1 Tax=Enterococcus xiangfangensis TaxID=1296537 RepID=A0ABU3FEG3_9ENTE|nr:hypothetical protein [Enterococcus xiangfangensis]MDT2760417.1 hypothetical protein [Enterococcus xiangfangensis]
MEVATHCLFGKREYDIFCHTLFFSAVVVSRKVEKTEYVSESTAILGAEFKD